VRTDKSVARRSFRFSRQWERDAVTGAKTPEIDRRLAGGELVDGRFIAHPLSGHERNHLFVNSVGKTFADLSAISGLDTPADSRGFVLFDYDRDGWQDIALINANDPLLNLYRNDIGRGRESGSSSGNFVAIRFKGGNRRNEASGQFGCRDGYGARVELSLGQMTLKREHRCGEGYATQNSNQMHVGTGNVATIPHIVVRWPSGKTQSVSNVASGTLLTVYENPTDSLSDNGIELDSYSNDSDRKRTSDPAHSDRNIR